MGIEEMSNAFDVLVSSYRRIKNYDDKEFLDSIEFNEYEKSLFLTKAQEDLVLSLYNGKNPYGESFENTEELRRYLANLVLEDTLSPITTTSGHPLGIESNSKFFTLPDDLWFITYETVNVTRDTACEGMGAMDVVPVTQDEYQRVKRNPFRGANGKRALRLDLADDVVEIVSKLPVTSYYVRYIKKLEPIVLEDLPDGISIEGVGIATPCKLHKTLHQKILELAVRMAMESKGVLTQREQNNK